MRIIPLLLAFCAVSGCGGSGADTRQLTADPASTPSSSIASISANTTILNRPTVIQTDGALNVYVLDGFNSTINRIDLGRTVTRLHREEGIGGLAITPTGNVFFNAAGSVKRVMSPNVTETVASGLATSGRMAIDGNGIPYAIEGSSVLQGTRDGRLTILFQAPQAAPLTALTVSRDVFFFASSAFIYQWTRVGGVELVATNDAPITDLAADLRGNVYFVDITPGSDPRFVSGTVKKLGLDRQIQVIAGSRTRAGYQDGPGSTALFNFPAGIAIGADGVLFVSDMLNNVVRTIDLRGQVNTYAGQSPS